MCHVSHVNCCVSHVTCHLSLTATATATYPSPTESPTMHIKSGSQGPQKTTQKNQIAQNHPKIQKILVSQY